MSSLTGSIIRRLERILSEIEGGFVKFRPTLPSFLEYVLVKLVYIGDKVIEKTIYYTRRASRVVHFLQISMIDSMIIASLWYGFILLILMLIILYLYSIGG